MLKGSPPSVAASLGAFGGAAGTAASGNAEERALGRVMPPPSPPQGGALPPPPSRGSSHPTPLTGERLGRSSFCFVRKKEALSIESASWHR